MQKLALSSIDVLSFRHLTDKPLDTLKVLFIPTAANVEENPTYVDRDRKILKDANINFKEFDISGQSKQGIEKALSGVDVVIVEGGNTFYLLEKVLESGFDEVIKSLLPSGVIYVGTSAGAVLAGPNIEPVKYFDNPHEASSLKSYEGLGLVNFIILPHFHPDDKTFEKTINEFGKKYKLIKLTNDQTILVEGNNWKLV